MNAIVPGRGRRSLEIQTRSNLSARPSAELMVTLLAPTLHRVARRYESDAQRRSELQQEMLIAVWLSLDTFEGSSSLGKWLNGVAHRVVLRHVTERRHDRRSATKISDLAALPAPRDPESILALRERAVTLLSLLDGLRRREREVVLLHLQEFELDEMSTTMKICRTQVRETLIRARRRLLMRMKKAELRGVAAFDAHAAEPLFEERNQRRATMQQRTPEGNPGRCYVGAPPSVQARSHGRA